MQCHYCHRGILTIPPRIRPSTSRPSGISPDQVECLRTHKSGSGDDRTLEACPINTITISKRRASFARLSPPYKLPRGLGGREISLDIRSQLLDRRTEF